MKRTNYFFASLIGFLPHVFIWNTVGAGLSKYIETADSFSFYKLVVSPEIYLPVLMFIGLVAFSLFIKKKFFDV